LSKAPVRTFLEEGPMSARLMRVGAPIQFHPFADIFPLLEGEAFAAFVENIKANGLLESIVVFKGKILDGRNRYRACLEAGIEPDFVDNSGDDPLSDVLSWNLHRRHLNESQRAWIEAKIANMPRGTNQHAMPPQCSMSAAGQFSMRQQFEISASLNYNMPLSKVIFRLA
jgi:hypothetical protein